MALPRDDQIRDLMKTAWTAISRAQKAPPGAAERRECLEDLLTRYREPVKAMVRAWGIRDEHKIEDRVQEYFTQFLEKNWLDQLDRERGRFRAFLRASVRNFLYNERDKTARIPRPVAVRRDAEDSDTGDAPEVADEAHTPEEEFNRSWARQLMQDAVEAFRHECAVRGLGHYAAVFERHVLDPETLGGPSYRETAEVLGMSEKDVTNHLHRARDLFRQVVQQRVRETVSSEQDVEQELADLQRYLS